QPIRPSMIHPHQLSSAWLSSETDPGSWRRGNRYFAEGRAVVLQHERLPDGGIRLIGSCQGTAFEPYRQLIEIERHGGDVLLDGECSCAVAFNCKHVVAVVVTWQARSSREPVSRDEIAGWLADRPDSVDPAEQSREALLYVLDGQPGRGGEIAIDFHTS